MASSHKLLYTMTYYTQRVGLHSYVVPWHLNTSLLDLSEQLWACNLTCPSSMAPNHFMAISVI